MRDSLARAASLFGLAALALVLPGCPANPKDIANSEPPSANTHPSFTVFIAEGGTNDVAVADSSGKVINAIPVGTAPSAIAFDDFGQHASHWGFVANTGSNNVSVIDGRKVAATIAVGAGPDCVVPALSFDSKNADDRVWVCNGADNTISELDSTTFSVLATYKTGPHPIAAVRAAQALLVLNAGDNTISALDPASGAILQTLQLGKNVVGMGVMNNVYVGTSDGTLLTIAQANPTVPPSQSPFAVVSSQNVATAMQAFNAVDDTGDFAYTNGQDNTIHTLFPLTAAQQPQSLAAGTDPRGSREAVITSGPETGAYLFVANRGSDNVSTYASKSWTSVSYTAGTPIALAPGSHPVAIAITYGFAPDATPTPAPSATPTPTPAPTATPVVTPTPAASNLYVANYGGNDVARYATPLGATSAPALTFADTGPVGIAVNSTYVVTSHITGVVQVYQQPVTASSAPVAKFGAAASGFMAFDPQGNLWATSQNSTVVEYVPPFSNATTESAGITGGFTDAYGIAFDSTGNMYVDNADASGTIVVYAPPYTSMKNSYAVPATNPKLHGMAIFGSTLYVADTHNNAIYMYNLPMTTNMPVDTVPATAPIGLTVDASGNLYVTTQGTDELQVFGAPVSSSSKAALVTAGVKQAFGIAVGP